MRSPMTARGFSGPPPRPGRTKAQARSTCVSTLVNSRARSAVPGMHRTGQSMHDCQVSANRSRAVLGRKRGWFEGLVLRRWRWVDRTGKNDALRVRPRHRTPRPDRWRSLRCARRQRRPLDASTSPPRKSSTPARPPVEPNLYIDREGTIDFVATLATEDIGTRKETSNFYRRKRPSTAPPLSPTPAGSLPTATTSPSSRQPGPRRAERVRQRGRRQRQSLDGGLSLRRDVERRRGQPDLRFLQPQRRPPLGQALRNAYDFVQIEDEPYDKTERWAGAWIQTWIHPTYQSHLLSDDGSRLFFNSFDPLVPHDMNGAQDVYEWEAPGAGDCLKTGRPSASATTAASA